MNHHSRNWIAPLAVAIVCLLLLPNVGFGLMGDGVLALAVMSAAMSAFLAFRRRDRYDLASLREFHEAEELGAIDIGGVSAAAEQVVCPRCGRAYKARLPICPDCGA